MTFRNRLPLALVGFAAASAFGQTAETPRVIKRRQPGREVPPIPAASPGCGRYTIPLVRFTSGIPPPEMLISRGSETRRSRTS